MRQQFRIAVRLLAAMVCAFALAAVTGCGDDGGSGAVVDPDPDTTVTVDQFVSGFSDETGIELTPDELPGGAVLLRFDDDGNESEFSQAETEFQQEYGSSQIYVVTADGDPDMIFDAVVGEPGKGEPIRSGGDTVRLDRSVADKPDADGVIWARQCVRYEKDSSLNSCAWTGSKRYGSNVIVSWTTTTDGLDQAGSKLDRAVSAVVASS